MITKITCPFCTSEEHKRQPLWDDNDNSATIENQPDGSFVISVFKPSIESD